MTNKNTLTLLFRMRWKKLRFLISQSTGYFVFNKNGWQYELQACGAGLLRQVPLLYSAVQTAHFQKHGSVTNGIKIWDCTVRLWYSCIYVPKESKLGLTTVDSCYKNILCVKTDLKKTWFVFFYLRLYHILPRVFYF